MPSSSTILKMINLSMKTRWSLLMPGANTSKSLPYAHQLFFSLFLAGIVDMPLTSVCPPLTFHSPPTSNSSLSSTYLPCFRKIHSRPTRPLHRSPQCTESLCRSLPRGIFTKPKLPTWHWWYESERSASSLRRASS